MLVQFLRIGIAHHQEDDITDVVDDHIFFVNAYANPFSRVYIFLYIEYHLLNVTPSLARTKHKE